MVEEMTPLIEVTTTPHPDAEPLLCMGEQCGREIFYGDSVTRIETFDEIWELCRVCSRRRSFAVLGEGRRKGPGSLPGEEADAAFVAANLAATEAAAKARLDSEDEE